jgi:hypothetical protein
MTGAPAEIRTEYLRTQAYNYTTCSVERRIMMAVSQSIVTRACYISNLFPEEAEDFVVYSSMIRIASSDWGVSYT